MELNLDHDQLIQWNGQTRQVIGLLQPKSKKEINLSVVPLQKGTLQLPKLAFKDTLLGRYYVFILVFGQSWSTADRPPASRN